MDLAVICPLMSYEQTQDEGLAPRAYISEINQYGIVTMKFTSMMVPPTQEGQRILFADLH